MAVDQSLQNFHEKGEWNLVANAIVLWGFLVGAVAQADATCIAAGLLLARGDVSVIPALAGCYLGTLGGDMLMVAIGRSLGWAVVDRRMKTLVSDRGSLAGWIKWIRKHSTSAAFVSRFLPGLSMPIHWTLGFVVTSPLKLLPVLALAGVVYVIFLVGLSYLLAESALTFADRMGIHAGVLMIAVGVTLFGVFRLASWFMTRMVKR